MVPRAKRGVEAAGGHHIFGRMARLHDHYTYVSGKAQICPARNRASLQELRNHQQ